jgi:UDP-N-acetylmuramate--alanine ligase
VTEIYAAREQPLPGVSGKLVVDALSDARPGVTPGWTPRLEDGARFLSRRARSGDLVLTLGAGDVDRAARLILEALP